MPERKNYSEKLAKIGNLIMKKRKALGDQYKTREKFVNLRSIELFNCEEWISSRYLANIELRKNMIGIEKLISLSYALEVDPEEIFSDIIEILSEETKLDRNK